MTDCEVRNPRHPLDKLSIRSSEAEKAMARVAEVIAKANRNIRRLR